MTSLSDVMQAEIIVRMEKPYLLTYPSQNFAKFSAKNRGVSPRNLT